MSEIIDWFKKLIEDWKKIIQVNNKIIRKEYIPKSEDKIVFPFIPLELDCYTLFNFFYQFFPKLFTENGDSLILILNENRDHILWSAIQHEENGNYLAFLEFEINYDEEILRFIEENSIERIGQHIQYLQKDLEFHFDLNFIIIVDTNLLEEFKNVHEMMKIGFLDYMANLWNFLANMYEQKRIQIYNEPLFFKFLRKFIMNNKDFDAVMFKNVITKLLPPQNVVFSLFNYQSFVAFAILTTPYKFVLTFLDNAEIKDYFQRIKKIKQDSNEFMVNFAKQLHKKYRIFYNEKSLYVNAAFVMGFDIFDYIKDIMSNYSFENFLVKFSEYLAKSDELWTSDGKIVLFRRWGNTFFDFKLEQFNPSSVLFFNSGIRFIYGFKARTLLFIFGQDIKLLTILGLDLKNGLLEKFYIIPKEEVNDIFENEKDVERAILIAKHRLSEQMGCWINTVIGVRYTDLNKFSAILSMATTVQGSLKFLKILDNFIKYEMIFLPKNPILEVMKKDGFVKTLKNSYFPIILKE